MARIVGAKEVAEYLRLNQNTIINVAVKGDLPGFKVGKSWRFDMDEIMAAITRLEPYADKTEFP